MGDKEVLKMLSPGDTPMRVNSSTLGKFNLIRFGVHSDGSCYLHAILRAFSKTYKSLPIVRRRGFIIQLRKELARNYTREIHESIGDGFFLTSGLPIHSYENMKKNIADITYWIDNELMEYVGDQLKVNVYMITGVDAHKYEFGNTKAHHKPGRNNVVLYWINDNHYEPVGELLPDNKTVRMVFNDDHPLIQHLNK